jgi:hypothetical protein
MCQFWIIECQPLGLGAPLKIAWILGVMVKEFGMSGLR